MPFEGAGVISRWKLELPREKRQFDFNTFADVIVHIKYTKREGGDLKNATNDALRSKRELIKKIPHFKFQCKIKTG